MKHIIESKLPVIAYFSMEIAVNPQIPTYSGGLGILAGDTLRAAADTGVPMVGVTLLHRKGYFRQRLDKQGNQSEEPFEWKPEKMLELLEPKIEILIENRKVQAKIWRYPVCGTSGYEIPVYFLDTLVPENQTEDQGITDYLYGGDETYRIRQEILLGFGGVAVMRALGYPNVRLFHMNEGHSAFLCIALLEEQLAGRKYAEASEADWQAVRSRCVFTTHTPVPAGHDQFPHDLVKNFLGENRYSTLVNLSWSDKEKINMTEIALFFSKYVNGVTMRHGRVSQGMFPHYPIGSITNGVHAPTWISAPFQNLFDRHIPEWRADSLNLRYAASIPVQDILDAHAEAKATLVDVLASYCQVRLDTETFTIGFARRATPYKRAELFFTDPERLRRIVEQVGPIQIIYGGKAHPKDLGGKNIIRNIFKAAKDLKGFVKMVYVEEYDMAMAKFICSGVDLWLNTPKAPNEASGTSGMKAALNGVPSLSVLDGWWIEGHIEGVTGWSIDENNNPEGKMTEEESMYAKLRYNILPMFYRQPLVYGQVMRSSIALNGSFFSAQRMLHQYLKSAYQITFPLGNNNDLSPTNL